MSTFPLGRLDSICVLGEMSPVRHVKLESGSAWVRSPEFWSVKAGMSHRDTHCPCKSLVQHPGWPRPHCAHRSLGCGLDVHILTQWACAVGPQSLHFSWTVLSLQAQGLPCTARTWISLYGVGAPCQALTYTCLRIL